jgi:hypothetical protein
LLSARKGTLDFPQAFLGGEREPPAKGRRTLKAWRLDCDADRRNDLASSRSLTLRCAVKRRMSSRLTSKNAAHEARQLAQFFTKFRQSLLERKESLEDRAADPITAPAKTQTR